MANTPSILAVVQARAGSKGLPGKNMRVLLGKPLLAWMIESARRSKRISRLILSTDSPEYASIGRSFGAETPFLRPAEYATDTATDVEVMTHAVSWLKQHEEYEPDLVVRLQPTNPTFPTELIDEGIRMLMEDPPADSVRPIASSPKHPYKMWRWKEDGRSIEPFIAVESTGLKEPYNLSRNILPQVYMQVGAMEVCRTKTLLADRSLAGKVVRGLLVSDLLYTVNIDSELDFLLAEAVLRQLLERQASAMPLDVVGR